MDPHSWDTTVSWASAASVFSHLERVNVSERSVIPNHPGGQTGGYCWSLWRWILPWFCDALFICVNHAQHKQTERRKPIINIGKILVKLSDFLNSPVEVKYRHRLVRAARKNITSKDRVVYVCMSQYIAVAKVKIRWNIDKPWKQTSLVWSRLKQHFHM